jgi:hypothetical protein
VPQAGEADNENEARAQSFDAVINLTETGALYEIDEESYAGGREDNSDGSKFSFRAWRFFHLAGGELNFDSRIKSKVCAPSFRPQTCASAVHSNTTSSINATVAVKGTDFSLGTRAVFAFSAHR